MSGRTICFAGVRDEPAPWPFSQCTSPIHTPHSSAARTPVRSKKSATGRAWR
ncbi:hypothetical protein [Streptomyces sp. B8F3]|uniref:hypothetical protein n=1 Tax=unclassified Streptomyces TaxID=2593676 RepID=UPI00325D4152